MKRSGMLAEMQRAHTRELSAMQSTLHQYVIDTLMICLHEDFGFGYDRCLRVVDKWVETFKAYWPAMEFQDEADVFQVRMDAVLAEILSAHKDKFAPFPERYPYIKQLGYGPKRNRK